MSDQATDQKLRISTAQGVVEKPQAKKDSTPPMDAACATTALAQAVADTGALKSADRPKPPVQTDETDAHVEATRPGPWWRRTGAQAAVLAMAVGLGWYAGAGAVSNGRSQSAATQWAEASASLRQSQEDVVRLAEDVRALKVSIGDLKDGIERVRGETVGRQTQLLERLDRVAQDSSGKANRVADQLERLASADRDPARFVPLLERLERMEKQANAPSANPKSAAAAAGEPAQTGSIDPKIQPDAKPATAKAAPLEGWVLRDIYDGMALVEGPNHRLHEIAPGQTLSSIGRVEAIERRGKAWVVVTSKGVIAAERWQ